MSVALLIAVSMTQASVADAVFNPVVEAQNYSKIEERQALYDTPQGQLLLREVSAQNTAAAAAIEANDPAREFSSDLCWNQADGCAGDARLYNWQAKGDGIVVPVVFTARDGATLSGHVWATRSGPAKRPGIVITNGSVQADEQMYWYAAQALAKAGYVVLTWDPQGQGQSDTMGAAPDQDEGVPAQTDGRPFFDGTEDAINFFYSTPSKPYVPESSCSTGTSHAGKQAARVAAGLDSAYNPYWKLFNDKKVGLAGHSYGAAAVSYIGQWDRRVGAIVAWDNLSQAKAGTGGQSFPPGEDGCPAHPADRADATARVAAGKATPALGMSADYFLPPEPNTSEPPDQAYCDNVEAGYVKGVTPSENDGLECKSLASDLYSKYGNDTGEIVIRGGSHLDFSFISNPAFGATLRGADLIDWYTTAWFDKYLKRDPSADARLLTNRWRHDSDEAAVDPTGDGNMFSFYHPSRLDFTLADGKKVDCEDLRAGCPALSDNDGYKGDYSYISIVTSPDGSGAPGSPGGTGIYGSPGAAKPRAACFSGRKVVVRLGTPKGGKIIRVLARIGKRTVGRARSARIGVRLGSTKAAITVRLLVTMRVGHRTVHTTVIRRYRRCARAAPKSTKHR